MSKKWKISIIPFRDGAQYLSIATFATSIGVRAHAVGAVGGGDSGVIFSVSARLEIVASTRMPLLGPVFSKSLPRVEGINLCALFTSDTWRMDRCEFVNSAFGEIRLWLNGGARATGLTQSSGSNCHREPMDIVDF